MIFFFQTWNFLQVQLTSFCYINAETKMKKWFLPLKSEKKCTSAANELLFHKCRYNRKMNLPLKSEKMYKSSYWVSISKMQKQKWFFSFKSEKNAQIQRMSFCFINAEKIGEWIFLSNPKKCTSPAIEFLLHKCRNKNDIFLSKKCTSPANELLLQ